MSLNTSKSKTQLAYARSTKTVNKPKTKTNSQTEQNDITKTKKTATNSTGNIYDSIMGQIDTTQQDYIKSLIVKNQKQSIKNQRQSQKQLTKITTKDTNQHKKSTTNAKLGKQNTVIQKRQSVNSHERIKSQAELLVKQSIVDVETEKLIKKDVEKEKTEPCCISEENQSSVTSSQVKPISIKNEDKNQQFSTAFPLNEKQERLNTATNPIIEALNNTSSSFSKKLQAFELQYPSAQREERITHKKVGSKLTGEYFSCQTSPKNVTKNLYAKEIAITTKPEQAYYSSIKNTNGYHSSKISPISSAKNSNQKVGLRKLSESDQNISTNFLSCLNQYLEVLSSNPAESQQNNRPLNRNFNMKRNSSTKVKQFQASKGFTQNSYAYDKQDEEEETIVLQNGNYHNGLHKDSHQKLLSLTQQQKLLKSLQKEKKKVLELKSIIDLFNQQLTKLKKKEKKMKQNQYHMIECLKSLNHELTQEKKQRRKLEEVVKQFESKIRGISRGKQKNRRGSIEQEQRPQRKTIYGASSLGNSIHYGQPMNSFYPAYEIMQKQTPHKLQKPRKKNSKNRFSSVINSMTQEYSRGMMNDDDQYDNYYPQKRMQAEEGLGKNRTQKISKIISSFQLDNQGFNDDQQMNYRPSQARSSIKNMQPPLTCKNNYMNSSLPNSRQNKSRPMTPKLIQELFKGSKNNKKPQQFFNQRLENNQYQSSSGEQQQSPEYRKQQYNDDMNLNQSSDSGSQFDPTVNSDESDQQEERNNRGYPRQQNEMLARMR